MKLKICGVKTVEEAEGLKVLKIDYVGLNFVPVSKRCISLETAKSIKAVLNGSGIHIVALFQDQPLNMVEEYARELDADYVQLHGDEPAEYAAALQKPVIRAIAVDSSKTADELINFISKYPADYFVLDRAVQGKGDTLDLALADKVIKSAPEKVCLAGGLTPDNLAGILSKVHPYAIDISSGVRADDQIDMDKVQRCQDIIRSATASRK